MSNQTGLLNVLWQSNAMAGGYGLSSLGGATLSSMSAPTLNTPTLVSGGSLTSGVAYYWKASAVNAAGETVGSNEVTVTPSGANLSASVSWAAVTGATSYRLFRSTVSGTYGATSLVATGITALSYTDTGAGLSSGTLLTVATDGFVTLAKDPTSALHATTKQYVDAAVTAASTGSAGNGIVKSGNTFHFAQSAAYITGGIPFASGVAGIGFDAGNLFWDDPNNRLGLLTNSPTHTLTLASTATGVALYATASQTVNYERLLIYWDGAQYNLEQQKGGSGIYRTLKLSVGNTFFSLGTVSLYGEVAQTAGDGSIVFDCVGMNASSNPMQTFFMISPQILQSGTSG